MLMNQTIADSISNDIKLKSRKLDLNYPLKSRAIVKCFHLKLRLPSKTPDWNILRKSQSDDEFDISVATSRFIFVDQDDRREI